jgi:hypothetical protein
MTEIMNDNYQMAENGLSFFSNIFLFLFTPLNNEAVHYFRIFHA